MVADAKFGAAGQAFDDWPPRSVAGRDVFAETSVIAHGCIPSQYQVRRGLVSSLGIQTRPFGDGFSSLFCATERRVLCKSIETVLAQKVEKA
jgi:hypothetical protein